MHTTTTANTCFVGRQHERLVQGARRVYHRVERVHTERANMLKRIHEDLRAIAHREVEHIKAVVDEPERDDDGMAAAWRPDHN